MTTDTLRQVFGTLRTPNGSPFPNKSLKWFRERRTAVAQGSSVVLDDPFIVTTDAAGEIDTDVMAGIYLVLAPLSDADRYFRVVVPDQAGPFDISSLIDGPMIEPDDLTQFEALVAKAKAWANAPRDTIVDANEYSAKHYAEKSKDWAISPENSVVEAGEYSAKHYAAKAELSRNYVASLEGRIGLPVWDQIKYRLDRQKVDFIGIGDSNQIYGGHGWDEGLAFALAETFQMYATGLTTPNENAGNGSGTGSANDWSRRDAGIAFMDFTGAPVQLEAFLENAALPPHYYGFVPSGSSKTIPGHGIGIPSGSALNVNANLRFDMWCGTFDTGSGSFDLSIRRGNSPFNTLTGSAPVANNTGVLGTMAKASVELAAGVRNYPLECLSSNNSRSIVGPWFGTYMRVVNLERSSGWAYSAMSYRGGQPLRTHAEEIQNISDTALVHFLQAVRDGQEGQLSKMFVFTVNTGLNERNESAANTSLGPNPATGGTAEALVDNFEAIRIRIEGIWQDQGWNTAEIYWLFFVSHPVDDPDDVKLASYREAISNHVIANVPRGQVVDLSALTTEAEMLAEGWYNSGGSDRNHLTISGYRELGRRVIGAAQ